MRSAAALLLALVTSACLTVKWERHVALTAPPVAALGELRSGTSELGDVLERFGAPLRVWEVNDGGTAVAYGWYHSSELGGNASVPLSDLFSASFDYNAISARLEGVVFFFDADLVLEGWREGFLSALEVETRRRPQAPEQP